MKDPLGRDHLEAGRAALAAGEWEAARVAFSAVIADSTTPNRERAVAAAGVSEASWWLRQVDDAMAARERAYESWRAAGDDAAAAREALWLAREYARSLGNTAAAQGWLARAESLAGEHGPADVAGWLALTRAWLTDDPQEQCRWGEDALHDARVRRDGELEVLALGRTALGLVSSGRVDEGLRRFDEAMAAATAGEASLAALATLCCDLALASERSGEMERFAQWNSVVERVATQHGHPPLLSFCATCCAEWFTAQGNWPGAEEQLRMVLRELADGGPRNLCLPPSAKLAELLLDQGRFEEAEAIVDGDDSDATLVVRARLALRRGEPALAVTLLERHCRRHGDRSLATAHALALLVDAHITAGDGEGASAAAARLENLATSTANRRATARAALARARLAIAAGSRDDEVAGRLEEAVDLLSVVSPGGLEVAEAHLELARLHQRRARDVARAEAKAALATFEAAGAAHRADEAAALLRSLGDRSRVGAKGVGLLTTREQEVLRLVAQGLSNAEIADRLFISVKTAGNHVSNILGKLNLRSRSEAAAWAVVHHP